MFKNLKVRSKLLVSFGIVIILYVITVIAAAIGLSSVSSGLKDYYNVPYQMVKSSLEARGSTSRIQLDVYRAHEATDDALVQEILADIDTETKALQASVDNLEACYEGDSALLQKVLNAADTTATPRAKAMEYIAANDQKAAAAIIEGEYADACNAFRNALSEVIDAAGTQADNYYNSGMSTSRLCFIILFSLAAGCIILTVILVFTITKGFTVPIAEIENAVKGMAEGNMHSQVTYQSRDELGVLADNLRFVLKTLSEYIEHICARLNSLAQGDLNIEMDMEYLGEFASIRESGNMIIRSLNDTMTQLNQASGQVASGSEQVSSGAQALSQGATEQASSVQELAATINELSEKVTQTARNSKDVNTLIETTAAEVDNSNTKMSAMMGAMTKINESSSEIEKIIKTIDDIAFQTNILALNAAVEAARAGEAGKGFAVVADEVRNLASKSAAAVKDTTSLIGNSLEAVSEGNRIAEDTQKSLLNVVANASKISTNMAKITEASDVQSEAIQQVTVGVDQISSVVQTNSATAEQSAAASQELFSQSSLLKNLVGRFHLKGMPSAPTKNAPPAATPPVQDSFDSGYEDFTESYDNSSKY